MQSVARDELRATTTRTSTTMDNNKSRYLSDGAVVNVSQYANKLIFLNDEVVAVVTSP